MGKGRNTMIEISVTWLPHGANKPSATYTCNVESVEDFVKNKAPDLGIERSGDITDLSVDGYSFSDQAVSMMFLSEGN